jgi:hypothetical protein
VALKPSAVPGTIISLSPFIWADRLLGHKVLYHTRKPRVSVTPVTKIGVLLCRSPAGTALVSWHAAQRPVHVDRYAPVGCLEGGASSEESEPVAMGLGCPLGCWGLVHPATTAAYACLPSLAV